MATSGQVQTNTEYDSYFWVKWEQVGDQDVANNRTQIKWTCGLYSEHKFRMNAIKMSAFSINGVQVYSGGTYSNFLDEGDQPIASGTLWIAHNADGTKSFSISSFTGWLYSNHNYSSNGDSFTLTAIPRKATIIDAADFADTGTPSLTFSNPGNFVLEVWLETNIDAVHRCTRNDISGESGTYEWDLTDEERDELISTCSGAECTIRYVLHSTAVGTTYADADYKDKTFTIEENDDTQPSVTMGIALNNGTLPSKFDGLYIQGKSKVNVTLSAEGKYNATIQSHSATIEGKTYNSTAFTSDVIQKAGKVDVVGYAVDSRGFTGTTSRQIDVVAYSKPSLINLGNENAILCYRSDSNGNRTGNGTSLWFKAKVLFSNVSQKNSCSLQWRRKLVAQEWGSTHVWRDLITYSDTESEYNALIPGEVFDLKESYTVQIRAIDDIREQDVKTFEIPTENVALHLGYGGNNVAIGTYCDNSRDRTFYCAWDAILDGEVYIGNQTLRDYILSVIEGG